MAAWPDRLIAPLPAHPMLWIDADAALNRNNYYAATAPARVPRPPLDAPLRCDVAVVGGGLAGLSAALDLRARGFDVAVLDAARIGDGASGRNGGQAIHGLACELSVVADQLGQARAREVFAMTLEALDLLRERARTLAPDCQWRDGWLAVATSPKKAKELQQATEALERAVGYVQQQIPAAEIGQWVASPRYHGGAFDPNSGHLHPLRYTLGLAAAVERSGVRVFEHTPVTRLLPGNPATLQTPQATVRADHVLLAGNVYLNEHGCAPAQVLKRRIMPVGTYIACTEVLPPEQAASLVRGRAAVCDTDVVLDYFRPTDDDRLLFGGRVSYSTATPADLMPSMRARIAAAFPQLAQARIDHLWGGFVDITMNRAPDFGRLEAPGVGATPNVYYLQGFSGHGVALTGLAGRLVAEAIAGDAQRFDTFAALRHTPFPGGPWLRTPALVLGMAWYRLRDRLS